MKYQRNGMKQSIRFEIEVFAFCFLREKKNQISPVASLRYQEKNETYFRIIPLNEIYPINACINAYWYDSIFY